MPLVTKNRVIGVIDIQSEQPNYFRPEHLHLLQLTASRVAIAVENARLYTRISRQAQSLELLHEISRELTSILDPEQLLERVGKLLQRVIPYQMFAIWMLDEKSGMLNHRFSIRFGKTDNSFSGAGAAAARTDWRRRQHAANDYGGRCARRPTVHYGASGDSVRDGSAADLQGESVGRAGPGTYQGPVFSLKTAMCMR